MTENSANESTLFRLSLSRPQQRSPSISSNNAPTDSGNDVSSGFQIGSFAFGGTPAPTPAGFSFVGSPAPWGVSLGGNNAPAPTGFSFGAVPAPAFAAPAPSSSHAFSFSRAAGLFGASAPVGGGIGSRTLSTSNSVPAPGTGLFRSPAPSQLRSGYIPQVAVPPQPTQSEFVSKFAALYNNQERADVTFAVQGVELYGNRFFLEIQAPTFWETITQGQSGNRIEIQGMSSNVFGKILKYIYTDKIEEGMDFDEAAEILYRSEMYKLEHLKSLCENMIARFMKKELALRILRASRGAKAANLEKFAMDFIAHNFDDTMKAAIRRFDVQSTQDGEMLKDILCNLQVLHSFGAR